MARSKIHYLTTHGWIHDQHGAWPMALLPILIGSTLGGWQPIHVPLLVTWFAGFQCFNAASLWAKARASARRRHRYIPAVLSWAAITALSGIVVLVLMPALMWWAVFFAPLIGVAAWEAWQRNERALLARGTTIVASTLMLPLAAWAGYYTAEGAVHPPLSSWPAFVDSLHLAPAGVGGVPLWAMTAILGAYFLATVPYVRSLIRGRNDVRWAIGSVGAHSLVAIVMTVACWWGAPWASWPLAVFWWAITIRAAAVPVAQRRGVAIRPAHIGIGEFLTTAILVALLLTHSPFPD